MPTTDDTPTAEGASNVLLSQRALDPPYHRQAINIQGDEHLGEAIGFDGNGVLGAISAAQMGSTSLVPVTKHRAVAGASGAATNKAAIEEAAAAAVAAGLCGIYIPAGVWHTNSGIVIPKDCDVIMDGTLLYTGSANEAALSIGSNAAGQNNTLRRFRLNVQRATNSDWANEGSIGIRFYSVYQSNIDIVQCNGFTVGLEVRGGLGTGSFYNTFRLGKLWNNKFAVRLTNSTGGCTNSNKFFGGTLSVNTGVNVGQDRIGIHITSDDGFMNNDNVFLGPAIELWSPDTTGDCKAVLIDSGICNSVMFARDELNDAPFLRETGLSKWNTYETDLFRGMLVSKGGSVTNGINFRITDQLQRDTFLARDDGTLKIGAAHLTPGPHVDLDNQGGGTLFREFSNNRFWWDAYEHIWRSHTGAAFAQIDTSANFIGQGNVEAAVAGKGFILKSPDGHRRLITVNNSGVLASTDLGV